MKDLKEALKKGAIIGVTAFAGLLTLGALALIPIVGDLLPFV